ncbi:hypothetical protein LY28_00042 [Ruminiclostridium sufflavum DSM 19573]|uniref:Uncharacterized protein n=1 Tax=Ruminiclostridium sufflavum DSM 19573 TaxID=1121337 RepID=A0A318YC12_9FIRM|nr:hypothetical protein [Ruminiclostridium sufflavum]PYG90162.1 hypothetical protein LY28_00042 [Ruminiclostridium sufflavum DSM 19573]
MTNCAAIGYMILAAKPILSNDQIEKIAAEMDYLMDIVTDQQAEIEYAEF